MGRDRLCAEEKREMDELTSLILCALEDSDRTLSDLLLDLDTGDTAAIDFLGSLVQEVIYSYLGRKEIEDE